MPEPCLADLLDPTPGPRHTALVSFITPAVVQRHHGVIARQVHGAPHCPDLDLVAKPLPTLCPTCLDLIDTLVGSAFRLLRRLLDDPPHPRLSKAGHLLRSTLRDRPDVTALSAAEAGRMLQVLTRPGRRREVTDPPWVWAAYMYLVHDNERNVGANVRRCLAARQGMASRPERDLRTAAWAKPLRDDPADLGRMIHALNRLRAAMKQSPGGALLLPPELSTALHRLRSTNPDYYAANVTAPTNRHLLEHPAPLDTLPEIDSARALWSTDQHPSEAPNTAARHRARSTLHRLLHPTHRDGTASPESPSPNGRRQAAAIVHRLCDVAAGHLDSTQVLHYCTTHLCLGPTAAETLVRRLTRLVADAGVQWTGQALASAAAGPD